eukprot:scaffold289509_cov22-Tisochrysis_lutea.AAC.2
MHQNASNHSVNRANLRASHSPPQSQPDHILKCLGCEPTSQCRSQSFIPTTPAPALTTAHWEQLAPVLKDPRVDDLAAASIGAAAVPLPPTPPYAPRYASASASGASREPAPACPSAAPALPLATTVNAAPTGSARAGAHGATAAPAGMHTPMRV